MTLASIIIPCYNSAKYLAEAVDSALAQTYPDKEVIVVDDGSTDDSPRIMAAYGDRIRVVRQANAGLSCARNAGIRAARGGLVAFLDADDWWSEDFLGSMVEALASSNATLAYCGWQNIGRPPPYHEPFVPEDYELSRPSKAVRLLRSTGWPVHAALTRREAVEQAGMFDPTLKSCEDFALWIRIATRQPIVRVPKVMAYYRFHGEQMTRNMALNALTHYQVQKQFLRENPEFAAHLSPGETADMTSGELLKRAYQAYWQRDLPAARTLFLRVMADRYGKASDWKYMLPSLLPLPLHQTLISVLGR